ncbi:hypothetical protein BV898_07855 [Hypsibius exemplaris]|uniref:Centromere protein X n=1 Tax=Hypsibius exemplaris TaxID=2072580 RepID=A0A1W0WSB7_HYPEX|nr:hypothetical protein BV898_07855 [Hypsibius exemplaris]
MPPKNAGKQRSLDELIADENRPSTSKGFGRATEMEDEDDDNGVILDQEPKEPAAARDEDEEDEAPPVAVSAAKFKAEVLRKCIESGFQDEKTKLTNEAVIALDEGLRFMIMEMLSRSANQALAENSTTVEVSHVEKILPQLMLDI